MPTMLYTQLAVEHDSKSTFFDISVRTESDWMA